MEIYRKNNIQCINCNEKGHTCKQCKQPTTSHGIIVFKINNNEPQYLMIQRRNTFHYVEFIRGKYETYNTTYLNSMFKGMTKEERNNILKGDFGDIKDELYSIVRKHGRFIETQPKSEVVK